MKNSIRTRIAVLAAGLLASVALPGSAQTTMAQGVPLAPDTSWVGRAVVYEVFVRSFSPSGDFQGVINGLDLIRDAGADVIWLMPIHPVGRVNRKGQLGSPYAVLDFLAVDSAYGSSQDLLALVRAAHARGMKVIIDWVPDHTAPDHAWTREHPDWYYRDSTGAPRVPYDLQGRPTDWTDVVQLDYSNPELRREMIATMRAVLEEFELDGFRQDVAHFVPADFWREANAALRAAIPRPLMLLAEAGELELHRAGFDLTYAWDAYSKLKAVWRGDSAVSFIRRELAEARAMPAGGARLRFTTNHDETGWDQPPVTLFGGSAGARAAFVAMALLPGRPLLYNGQEVESPQKLRLFYQDTLNWYQSDTAQARAFYRRVIQMTATEAGRRAPLAAVETSAPADIIAYRRGNFCVLVNARNRAVNFTVSGFDVAGSYDVLAERLQRVATVMLPAYGAVVLAR